MAKQDFEVHREGNIFLLRPLTRVAQAWCDECLPRNVPRFGKAYVVEPRYIRDIVADRARRRLER